MRESLFLNGILTNSDVWYGLTGEEIDQLEALDRNLLRQILKTPLTTPSESLFLELGCIDIRTVIKARRLNYLHYLVTSKESGMLHQFFSTQWKYPSNRKDWTEQVRLDMQDFGIPEEFDFIKSKSKFSFSNMVKYKSHYKS